MSKRASGAFRQLALERLQAAYPSAAVEVEMATCEVCERTQVGRYRLTAYINSQLAFGAGYSMLDAIERLLSKFKPYTDVERIQIESTHTGSILSSMYYSNPNS